jgi:hypothetical protein
MEEENENENGVTSIIDVVEAVDKEEPKDVVDSNPNMEKLWLQTMNNDRQPNDVNYDYRRTGTVRRKVEKSQKFVIHFE